MARMDKFVEHGSPFPLLSLLLSLAGVLVFVLVVASIGHLDVRRTRAERRETFDRFETVRFETERVAADAERARGALEKEKEGRATIAQLHAAVRASEELQQRGDVLEEELRQAASRLAEVHARLNAAQGQIAELQVLRDRRADGRSARGSDTVVRVVGTARRSDDEGLTEPFFVECRGSDLILHPSGNRVSSLRLSASNSFSDLIDRVRQRADRGALLVLLVRPDGVKAFDRARGLIEERGTRYGFLPLPGFGAVDLSAFSVKVTGG